MSAPPVATVVVVARDRWTPAPRSLEQLLVRTDPRHPIVIVDGAAPPAVAAVFDVAAASGRARVARRMRFLASNEARNLGAEGASTEWVAFVENDCIPSDGWLERLLAFGEANDAASVYPAYLEEGPNGLWVHGLGADLEVTGPFGSRSLREIQPFMGRPWAEVTGVAQPAVRLQAEPHLVVVRREVLDRIGGLDEALLGWFEHIDLALHHQRLALEAWVVPDVTCLYQGPPPVARRDLGTFALRWGADWFGRSLDHLCETWGFARDDAGWEPHIRFRTAVRHAVMTRSARVNRFVERAAAPWEHRLARRWHDASQEARRDG